VEGEEDRAGKRGKKGTIQKLQSKRPNEGKAKVRRK